ncbi:sugar phosphate isomerase/epimerase [Amycolatopsis sp. YIM 10]|uniref:sugar phosphate isomerase/epimerase family protein n=1 Tax=Amycolatopsis sp. YIM 10 TaxID=2653857 RepID=UPI0012907A0F|nr:sugar phosphate isomerase/epimerase family protein [Amycolatopsis sp. YIM 10]QFU92414.1 Xylose isomerase-like TIM barrel [Amycolatopsis sp. YIM 10]
MRRELSFAGIGDEAGARLPAQVTAIRRLGWRQLELRSVDGRAIADLGLDGLRRVETAIRDAGVEVVCLDSRIGNWARPITVPFARELHELDELIDWCLALDTRFIRIMSYPNAELPEDEWRSRVFDRVRRLAERAAEVDVVLLHENCSGWAGASAERALELVTAVGNLRLLYNTGNGLAHGYCGHDLLAEIVDYVEHVHVKDAVVVDGMARFCLPGHGEARVADSLRLLLAHGYRGAFSLEPQLNAVPRQGKVAGDTAADAFVAAGRALTRLGVEIPR